MATHERRKRRPRGSAWHWKQTDGWYFTPPGTKRRVPLVDGDGKRVRGKANRQAAELALARVKVAGQWRPTAEPAAEGEWLVAKVCSQYLEYCQRRLADGRISEGYRDEVARRLNQLCEYCGALPVSQLTRGHIPSSASYNRTRQEWSLFVLIGAERGPESQKRMFVPPHSGQRSASLIWSLP